MNDFAVDRLSQFDLPEQYGPSECDGRSDHAKRLAYCSGERHMATESKHPDSAIPLGFKSSRSLDNSYSVFAQVIVPDGQSIC